MAFSLPIDVRFADLDAMGHVNHAVFLSYPVQVMMNFQIGRPRPVSIATLAWLQTQR